jgi:hypothetical protein
MQAIWLLAGVITGALLTLVALRPRLRALAEESGRADGLERDLVRAQADLEHERSLSEERLRTLATRRSGSRSRSRP